MKTQLLSPTPDDVPVEPMCDLCQKKALSSFLKHIRTLVDEQLGFYESVEEVSRIAKEDYGVELVRHAAGIEGITGYFVQDREKASLVALMFPDFLIPEITNGENPFAQL